MRRDARRVGIGRRLVVDAEASLGRRGARRIRALVLADEIARAFWSAIGYDEDEGGRRFVKTFPSA